MSTEVNHCWETMASAVKIDRKIVVTPRMGSGSLTGKLLSIGDQSITIQQPGGDLAIARVDVLRVHYARFGYPAVVGALAGAAIGGPGGWAADHGSAHFHPAEAIEMGTILGAAAGAIVGKLLHAIVGALLHKGASIYEAAAPVESPRES
jgi:hypothetical protein